MEGTFSQGDNNLRKADTVDRNLYTEWTKSTITNQSWNLGFYYDFKSDKKFTLYLGGGIGTTKLNLVGIQEKWNDNELPTVDDFESYSRMSYFGKIGVSYKINKNSDVFLENTYRVINDIKKEVGNYPNPQTYSLNFGLRYRY